MSDISIPGVSSKYNTTKLIENLVAAETIRLTLMEEQVEELENTRSIWRQLNRSLGDLQRSVKSLYGFENPFSEKNALSSNENILTATANRAAPFDSYEILIKQVATADRFLTPSLERSFRVQSGTYTFTVGEESLTLRYRGGTLDDFARRLSEKGEGLIRAATVRDTSSTQVLMIEAIPTGSENRLLFQEDAQSLALETGMMRPSSVPRQTIDVAAALSSAVTASGSPLPEGSVETAEEGALVQPSSSLRLDFDTTVNLEDGMILEYRYRTIDYSDSQLAPASPPGPNWPEVPDGRYQDITIRGAANSFPLPSGGEWQPPQRRDSRDIFSVDGPGGSAALPQAPPSGEFRTVQVNASDLPGQISSIVLNNDNTHRGVEIAGIRVYDPNRQGDLEPARAVNTAGDAIIEFRGIEARRSTNSIDDLVDGLTLNLERASTEPVTLDVEPDTEAAKEGVIKFVFSYNRLLTRILVLANDNREIVDELEYLNDTERENYEEQLGVLRGDLTLNQIKSRLQTIVSNPYPTRAREDLTLLAQIGISTNASSGSLGGSLNYSKLRGYLEIDEEKLDAVLQENIEAVKDLFGKDTTGDLVINSGVGQALDSYITPYTQTGGLVSNRISRIDTQIESKEDDITDYKEYLETYEADLKRQYGNMEGMLNQLERSSRELDNFNNRSRDN